MRVANILGNINGATSAAWYLLFLWFTGGTDFERKDGEVSQVSSVLLWRLSLPAHAQVGKLWAQLNLRVCKCARKEENSGGPSRSLRESP